MPTVKTTDLFDDACDAAWFHGGGNISKSCVELNKEQEETARQLRELALEYKFEVWSR